MTTEQPDWAVRAAQIIVSYVAHTKTADLADDKIAALIPAIERIIRANSPDVGKLREASEKMLVCVARYIEHGGKLTASEQDTVDLMKSALASVPQPRGDVRLEPVPMMVKDGWTVDFNYLQSISVECMTETEGVSLEMVEAVILALAKRCAVSICAAESIPAETLTDELATALREALKIARYTDDRFKGDQGKLVNSKLEALESLLDRYEAQRPKP